jgi:hypothetical protein
MTQGSSLVSIYPVFRNGQWQRVPALMLVRDDLIAMGTGDITPARAVPYIPGWAPSPAASEGLPFPRNFSDKVGGVAWLLTRLRFGEGL